MARTRSTSILDLEEGDVVIPHTAEYQEWPVAKIEETSLRRSPVKITWGNGDTTHHSYDAWFSVKTG